MLETVLSERKAVKKKMKAHDPSSTMYRVLDGRQLSLKVVANSIYGFTGTKNSGLLPEKRIAASVTKSGRLMIEQTKDYIENHPMWGIDHGCKCIYGDSDSTFIRMPRTLVDGADETTLMENAHAMGEKMAAEVTKIFLKPIVLEYEKSYSSFLLMMKKRYAGHKYEPGLPPSLQIKGLEAVRRDPTPLVVVTQKKML